MRRPIVVENGIRSTDETIQASVLTTVGGSSSNDRDSDARCPSHINQRGRRSSQVNGFRDEARYPYCNAVNIDEIQAVRLNLQ